jgi:hypothetical protein
MTNQRCSKPSTCAKSLTRAEAAEPHATDRPTWYASTTMVAAQVCKLLTSPGLFGREQSPRRWWRSMEKILNGAVPYGGWRGQWTCESDCIAKRCVYRVCWCSSTAWQRVGDNCGSLQRCAHTKPWFAHPQPVSQCLMRNVSRPTNIVSCPPRLRPESSAS